MQPRQYTQRMLLLGGVVIISVVLVSWLAWPRSEPSDTRRTSAVAARADAHRRSPITSPEHAAPLSRVRQPRPTDSAAAPLEPDLQELADEAEHLSAMARYPPWSQPLDLIGDPIASAESAVSPAESSGPDPVLTVYPERNAFDAPEPIVVHAYLKRDGRYVPARSMAGTVLDSTAAPVMELTFTSTAPSGGGSAGDTTYAASFTPPAVDSPNAGYGIRVRAISADGDQREAQAVVTYNQPYARLTGHFRDQIGNGNLVIEAEVAVQQLAAFRLEGSLYSQDGRQPLAWASATAALAPGTSWMQLTFYGLILRERGMNGPYLLRFASLTAETEDAEATTRAVENAYVTQAHDAEAFGSEVFNDPEVLAEATTLRERMDRLQRNPPE